jgi:hypothetical protein
MKSAPQRLYQRALTAANPHADFGRAAARIPVDLSPGEPHHGDPLQGEIAVTPLVVCYGRWTVVERRPVTFDGEPSTRILDEDVSAIWPHRNLCRDLHVADGMVV